LADIILPVEALKEIFLASSLSSFDRVGRNVAAGMTGGLAYILDEDDTLIPKVFSDPCLFILPDNKMEYTWLH